MEGGISMGIHTCNCNTGDQGCGGAVSDGGWFGRVNITFGWTRLDELLLDIFLRDVGAFSRGDLEA